MFGTFFTKLCNSTVIPFLFFSGAAIVGILLMIKEHSQTLQSKSAQMAMHKFPMEIDPNSVTVDPVPMIPEINIVSRQTIFFKDEQGWFIAEKASRPTIVNTCDQALRDLRVVWHLPTQRDNPLPEMVANILDLSEALINLDVLDSKKAENQGNSCDITPSTLLPGESAPVTAVSKGVQQWIDESGFAKGHLYVVADAANGLKLTMAYGFEFETQSTSPESLLCRIFELSGVANNQSGPKQ